MPVAYLDVPEGIEIKEKEKLVKGIYDALCDAYRFSSDHRIFVREWPLGSVSQNGQLGWESPRLIFQILGPQGLDIEAKRRMMKGITAAVANAYNNAPELVVFLQELSRDQVAINGTLNVDDPKHLEGLDKPIEASSGLKAAYRQ